MKKFFYRFGIIAAIFAASVSCSKNDSGETPEEQGVKREVKVTFTKGADTKTAVVEGATEASYVWTEGDEQYLTVYENDKKGTIESVSYSSDYKTATMTVLFNTTEAEEYVYRAVYAHHLSNHGNPQMLDSQSPKSNSYDPAADVMVSREITQTSTASALNFTMGRVVTVNKMTLTGLEEGEVVSKVEFSLDKNFVGGGLSLFKEVGDALVKQEPPYTVTNNKKTLTLNYTENNTVGRDGKFPVYFTCSPVEGAAITSVVVVTDKNVYTKPADAFTGKTITFAIGTMKRFTMAMNGYSEPISSNTTYTLVSSDAGLKDGVYVIASSEDNSAMGSLSGSFHSSIEVTKSDGKIDVNNSILVLPVIITKVDEGQWTIKNDDANDANYGKYISWDSGNSSTEQDDEFYWSISITDGVASIQPIKDNTRYLQYNSASPRFACYTNTQKNPALYLDLTTATEPISRPAIKIISDNPMSATNGNDIYAIEYSITNPVEGSQVSATSNVLWIHDFDYTTSGEVDFEVDAQAEGAAARTGVITLSYPGAKDVKVTVNQAAGAGAVSNPYSMTPNSESTGRTETSYITSMTSFTYGGIAWNMNQWNPSNLQIKTNQGSAANEFRFYNTSAFPGRITKVVITFSALTVSDASKLMFLGGTSEVTATTGGTAGTWDPTNKTLTWTPAATDKFTYFAFYQNGKAASGTNKLATSNAIVVTYE